MPFAFFRLPADAGAEAAAPLNRFLRTHQVVRVSREWCPALALGFQSANRGIGRIVRLGKFKRRAPQPQGGRTLPPRIAPPSVPPRVGSQWVPNPEGVVSSGTRCHVRFETGTTLSGLRIINSRTQGSFATLGWGAQSRWDCNCRPCCTPRCGRPSMVSRRSHVITTREPLATVLSIRPMK